MPIIYAVSVQYLKLIQYSKHLLSNFHIVSVPVIPARHLGSFWTFLCFVYRLLIVLSDNIIAPMTWSRISRCFIKLMNIHTTLGWCYVELTSFSTRSIWRNFTKKMRRKTHDFHWICWMMYVHSFRKGITSSDWNSTFSQILGKIVTSFPPFLQYFITNKCRLLPWIHPKEIIFYHFIFWI